MEAGGELVEPVAPRSVEPRDCGSSHRAPARSRRAGAVLRRAATACPRACARRRRPDCRSSRGARPRPGPAGSRIPARRRRAASSARAPACRRGLSRTHAPTGNGCRCGYPFSGPATGEVEQLAGLGGHRQRQLERRRPGNRRHRSLVSSAAAPHQPARGEFELDGDGRAPTADRRPPCAAAPRHPRRSGSTSRPRRAARTPARPRLPATPGRPSHASASCGSTGTGCG